MRNKILLGVNNANEIVFADVEITTRNGYEEFTASFEMVVPFGGTSEEIQDKIYEYYDGFVWGIDDAWKYQLCEQYDCKPSELVDELANSCEDVRDAIDCSLYPNFFYINGKEWYFESSSCGQADPNEVGMKIYTNKEMYDMIYTLWKQFHLQKVTEDCKEVFKEINELANDIDEDEWIVNYIKENLLEGGEN